MELTDYLRIVRRRWVWIVVAAIVCVAAAAGVTALQTKEYASSARLFVSTSSGSSSELFQGGQFSQERVQSYADLVSSRELAQQVIKDLGLSMKPTELAGEVSATVATNTVNLTITATDPDPHRAQSIAQSYADHLTDMVRQLETPPGKTRAPIKATIVDNASLPISPVSPKPVRNVGLGLVLGLLIGFGLAVLRHTLDTRIHSGEDVVALTDKPVLGTIGYDPTTKDHPLVTGIPSHSARAEAMRVLRTNLQFVDVDADHKVFVFTSAVPEEGKTTTAVNLALSLAEAGVRTLLMEGDLRRPRAAARLGKDGAVGLTNVLVGRVKQQDALQRDDVTGLDFLASGPIPPNPAELLQSKAMSELLATLRNEYDVVVIDAPPLLPVTDAALIASHADGAILVLRHGVVTRDQLRGSKERLDQVDARLVGTVINMVPTKGRSYGYGYGYGYAPDPSHKA